MYSSLISACDIHRFSYKSQKQKLPGTSFLQAQPDWLTDAGLNSVEWTIGFKWQQPQTRITIMLQYFAHSRYTIHFINSAL